VSPNPRPGRRITIEPDVRELLMLAVREPRVAMRYAAKLWLFYLNSLVAEPLDLGHRSYTRFVILGRYRSGSNLVRGSLMSHGRIVAFGDVFRSHRYPAFGVPFYRCNRASRALFEQDPVRFLETRVFGGFPARVSAVGLKLLYTKKPASPWEAVRAALADAADVRAIHVKRENILRAHTSMMMRLRDGGWKSITGRTNFREPIALTYEDCLDAFVTTRRQEELHDSLFPAHRRLDVCYERLCADYASETERMQEFLGVPVEPLRPLTHKQTRTPLRATIANFDELAERFRDSEWERFFADDA
jgi:LPS sulfotransferase NodH